MQWRDYIKFALGILALLAVCGGFVWLVEEEQRERERAIRLCAEKRAIAVVLEGELRCVREVE